MDPSYNQVPQPMPQAPQMPISSGAGLSLSQSEKKPKKGLIVGVVILIVMAIIGIVVAVMLMPRQEGAGNVATESLKDSYNRFVNYVVFCKESNEDVAMNDVEEATWCYTEVEDNTKVAYLEKTTSLYEELKNSYNNTVVDGTADLDVLKTLFIDSVEIDMLDSGDILSSYVTSGEEITENMIMEKYEAEQGVNDDVKGLLEVERALAETYLSIMMAENSAGCIVDGAEVEGCYTMTEEEQAALSDNTGSLFGVLLSFNTRSLDTFSIIHEIVYGAPEEVFEEEVNNE